VIAKLIQTHDQPRAKRTTHDQQRLLGPNTAEIKKEGFKIPYLFTTK